VSDGYRAVLFDLFGTLIHFDMSGLPEVEVDGRRVRATSDGWSDLLAEAVSGVSVAVFVRALWQVSTELDEVRRSTAIEFPSRERFRRALVRVGCEVGAAEELAPLFARAHMRRLADTTRFPAAHARLLEQVSARAAVAVVSNFDDTSTAYTILARHGIVPRVGIVVVSEALGLRKPHPALVRVALRELDVSAAEAVMIGDHAIEDVGAATAAGVDAILIDPTGSAVTAGNPAPRYVVRALAEVVPILSLE
jgi:FMN phosphatase YigB (HAD superfamily)